MRLKAPARVRDSIDGLIMRLAMGYLWDNSRAMAEWKMAAIACRFLGNGNYIWLGSMLQLAIAMQSNGSKALNATHQVAGSCTGASQVQIFKLRLELLGYMTWLEDSNTICVYLRAVLPRSSQKHWEMRSSN